MFRGLLYRILESTACIWPDKLYIKLRWFACGLQYPLNLNSPQTFNEKLQWLKLYDRNPFYSVLCDKYLVKDYIRNHGEGKVKVIPLLGVYDQFEDIDFSKLPNQFVLKTTHDSGTIIICEDKNRFDIESAKRKLNSRLKVKYWLYDREWPYKDIKPRIIAEEYMVDDSGFELKDYKFFCFNGEPHFIQVDYGRFTSHKRNFYDTNWNRQRFTLCYPTDWGVEIPKPEELDDMLDVVRLLSSGIPHVRVDLYLINHAIYFGEMTFYHGGGNESFKPVEWDYKLGELIKLPERQ